MTLSPLFEFQVSPLELVIRGTAIYWLLFVIFRFLLRRDIGAVGVADVLMVVLIADASQNAMSGGYTSLAEGAVLVATLVAWNYTLDWAAFRFRFLQRVLEPPPLLLVRQGRVQMRNLRVEHLTVDDLRGMLREKGIDTLDTVKVAYLESDGAFSVVRNDGAA